MLAVAAPLLLSGMSEAGEPPPNETPEAAIRRLIPEAAGLRNADVGDRPEDQRLTYDRLRDRRFTAVLFFYPPFPKELYKELYPKLAPALARELNLSGPVPASQLWNELGRSRPLGYCSMLQPDRITAITCRVDGEVAKGNVSFKVPELYEGQVQYSARHTTRGWELTEFEMPAHHWRCVRTERGTWLWYNRIGEMSIDGWLKHLQPVSGKLTFRERPLAEARLMFYHTEDPFLSESGYPRAGHEGQYEARLSVGTYHVVVEDSQLNVVFEDAKPRQGPPRRLAGPLKIDVRQGKNSFDLDFQR